MKILKRRGSAMFKKIYYFLFGSIIREYNYRKRLKELKKRDPFIY